MWDSQQLYDVPNPETPWIPNRPVMTDYGSIESQDATLQLQAVALPPTQAASPVDPSGTGGIPETLVTLSASQAPAKIQGRTLSTVSVIFTRDSTDPNFGSVDVWFKNYQANTVPQLIASGASSPITFLAEATGETVTVFAQPVGTGGKTASLDFALTTTVTLSGVVTSPPAPTVTQSLVSLPLGFQFTFALEGGLLHDLISCYKVYRNTTNTPGSAVVIQTYPQPQNNTGQIVFQDYTLGANATAFYWVSAVNTAGLESSLAAAGNAVSGVIGTGSISNSFAAYTPTTNPLTQHLTTTQIDIASFQIQFPAPVGLVTYTSSSVDPGSFGTYLIYCDDPNRTGGAVTFHFTTSSAVINMVDGRLYIGQQTTISGGGGTGRVGGGGSCFTGNTRLQGGLTFLGWENGRTVTTSRGTQRPATLLIHDYKGPLYHMGDNEYVTPGHRILVAGRWVAAKHVFKGEVWYEGKVFNLSVEADDTGLDEPDTEHSFTLANGYVAHNVNKL